MTQLIAGSNDQVIVYLHQQDKQLTQEVAENSNDRT